MKQLQLSDSTYFKSIPSFGGELNFKKRKSRRPLDASKPLHLVLRADVTAPIFLHREKMLDKMILRFAKKFGLKIFESSVNANHLHLVISFKHRLFYKKFVAALTGRIAYLLKIKWLNRPFTRIINWGRDFKNVCAYVLKNQKEAWGLVSYKRPRSQIDHNTC
jgi:REP element-mobilizing transposase RayT